MYWRAYNYQDRISKSSLVNLLAFSRLEQPCLGHLFGDPNNPDEPNYHSLTASAQLQFAASPSSPQQKRPVVPSFQEDREVVLDRLLNLAPDVCSEDEVTPVQAWNYIRGRPLFGGLRVQDLRTFVEKLREAVACHGYVKAFSWSLSRLTIATDLGLSLKKGCWRA